MCGIAGLIVPGARRDLRPDLQRMTDDVKHRGPDGEGTWVAPCERVGFGHRRLSILDLSERGAQPMIRDDLGLTLTFVGEIYNYVELRDVLRDAGYEFASDTDSEVILAAYHHWGAACVDRFNGMWGFAIHDAREDQVFLSRDPFGIKPFYLLRLDDLIAFGSEIRQLLPFLTDVQANDGVVVDFLCGGASEPHEQTFFQQVEKLPGGNNAVVDIANGQVEKNRYYYLVQDVRGQQAELSSNVDARADGFADRLRDAIRLRLRSDVRVGTCLSGGLDSSTVAALGSGFHRTQEPAQRFAAVTAVSELAANDESDFARQVVERHDLDWTTTRPSYETFRSMLPGLVRAQEEPFRSPSLAMQYAVMQAARGNGITVLLDGQGGDELLLGYSRYLYIFLVDIKARYGLLRALRLYVAMRANNKDATFKNLLRSAVLMRYPRVGDWLRRRNHGYIKTAALQANRRTRKSTGAFDLVALQEREIRHASLPELLRYEDKSSMAHSIEARLPFLDPKLVSYAVSLPGTDKIKDGWTKYILRRTADSVLPSSVTWRRDKIGFQAPDDIWLRHHRAVMEETIMSSEFVRHYCDISRLERQINEMKTSTLWRLYSLALWAEEFGVTPADRTA